MNSSSASNKPTLKGIRNCATLLLIPAGYIAILVFLYKNDFTTVFWITLVGSITAFVIWAESNRRRDRRQNFENHGWDISKEVISGKYIAGHPGIDNSIKLSSIIPKNDELVIFGYPEGIHAGVPDYQSTIKLSAIKNISVEDASTIESKVTVGRLLAVGIFAFALKKKGKHELSYLTIQWNDGRFDHDTYFEFEGNNAIQNAHAARNKLINILR